MRIILLSSREALSRSSSAYDVATTAGFAYFFARNSSLAGPSGTAVSYHGLSPTVQICPSGTPAQGTVGPPAPLPVPVPFPPPPPSIPPVDMTSFPHFRSTTSTNRQSAI